MAETFGSPPHLGAPPGPHGRRADAGPMRRGFGKVRAGMHMLRCLTSSSSTRSARAWLDVQRRASAQGWTWLVRTTTRTLRRRYGVHVSGECSFGPGLTLPHPVGVVIGAGVRMGCDVTLYQNVTLGALRRGDGLRDAGTGSLYPSIGDCTTIFSGAAVLGGVRVGRGCTIGANAVVLSDVPDGATAVGVPARIIPAGSPFTGERQRGK